MGLIISIIRLGGIGLWLTVIAAVLIVPGLIIEQFMPYTVFILDRCGGPINSCHGERGGSALQYSMLYPFWSVVFWIAAILPILYISDRIMDAYRIVTNR